jgi:hypothetical protein
LEGRRKCYRCLSVDSLRMQRAEVNKMITKWGQRKKNQFSLGLEYLHLTQDEELAEVEVENQQCPGLTSLEFCIWPCMSSCTYTLCLDLCLYLSPSHFSQALLPSVLPSFSPSSSNYWLSAYYMF